MTSVTRAAQAPMSALPRMALISGAETAVRVHLRRVIDINGTDEKGHSSLMLAAARGHLHICRLLLTEGAIPGLQDRDGRDASAHAAAAGYDALAVLIRQHVSRLTLSTTVLTDEQDISQAVLPAEEDKPGDGDEGVSGWEAEPETVMPPADDTAIITEEAVQTRLSRHVPLDTDEEWTKLKSSFRRSGSGGALRISSLTQTKARQYAHFFTGPYGMGAYL